MGKPDGERERDRERERERYGEKKCRERKLEREARERERGYLTLTHAARFLHQLHIYSPEINNTFKLTTVE